MRAIRNVLQYIAFSEVIIVFDVDGVLAPYEFDILNHSMPDEKWDEMIKNGENPYDRIDASPKMQELILCKDIKKVYVCSKCTDEEEKVKREFVQKNYGIVPENIFFVREQDEKINVLEHIKKIEDVAEQQIATIEDTVKTLDAIRKSGDYITVHISSFVDRCGRNCKRN